MTTLDSSERAQFGAGKVILLGEHAVVYGQPALAFALKQGIWATLVPASECRLKIPSQIRGQTRANTQSAFLKVARELGLPKVSIELKSDLPLSMGLGSSAAVSVAVSKALLSAAGEKLSTPRILQLAQLMEGVFHGTPSGVDHCTSVYETAILFQKTAKAPRVKPLKLERKMQFVVAWAGQRGNTSTWISALRERQKRWPLHYQRVFHEIGRVVRDGVRAMEQGDSESLGDLMNINHGLLSAMQLSMGTLEELVYTFRRMGAFGAKLTGAGGVGGAVVGVFPDAKRAQRKLSSMGIRSFVTEVTPESARRSK